MMKVLDVNNWTNNLKPRVINLLQPAMSASSPKIPRLSNENDREISKPKNKCAYMFREVAKILNSDKVVELPPMTKSEMGTPLHYLIQKIAWWILKSEKDAPMFKIIHPENSDLDLDLDESVETELCIEEGGDDDSFFGNVSDPEGKRMRKMDLNKIHSVDEEEELCGKTSLEFALIRNVFSGDSSTQDFVPYLIQAPDTNINRASFKVECRVCNVNLLGARGLSNHLLQESHKKKFRNLSLDLASDVECWEKPKNEKLYSATLKSYDSGQSVADLSIQELEIQNPSKDNHTSICLKLPSLGSKNTFENVENEFNERLHPLKQEMEIKNDWNIALHKKWNTALDEETRLIQQYYEDVEKFLKDVKSYPDYVKEWEEFWCAKNDELLNSGKDADQFNYEGLWKKVWPKKLKYVLKKETDEKILQMRKKLGMDYESLNEMATTPSSQIELQVGHEGRSYFPPSCHSNYLSGRYRSSQTSSRHENNGNRSSQSRSPRHYSNQRSSQSYNRQNSRSRSPRINPNKGISHRNVNRGSSKHHGGSRWNPSNSNQNIAPHFNGENRSRNNDWHNKKWKHHSNFKGRKRNHSGNFRQN